jgi:hypothetical protein
LDMTYLFSATMTLLGMQSGPNHLPEPESPIEIDISSFLFVDKTFNNS